MAETFRAAVRITAALQTGRRPDATDACRLSVPRTNAELAREAVRRTRARRSQ